MEHSQPAPASNPPGAVILRFPAATPRPDAAAAAAQLRLQRAVVDLQQALAAQRQAIAQWRDTLGTLEDTMGRLAGGMQRHQAGLGRLSGQVSGLRQAMRNLEDWADAQLAAEPKRG